MKAHLITSRKSGGEGNPVPSICSDSSDGRCTSGWLRTTCGFCSTDYSTTRNIKDFVNSTQFRSISILSDTDICLGTPTTLQFHMSGCGVSLSDLTGDQNGSPIGYPVKTRGTILLQLAGESFTAGTFRGVHPYDCSLVIIITTRTPTRLSTILLFMSLTTISTSWVNLHPSIF